MVKHWNPAPAYSYSPTKRSELPPELTKARAFVKEVLEIEEQQPTRIGDLL